jgi:hypothetical protein
MSFGSTYCGTMWKNLVAVLQAQQHDYHDSMVNNWFTTCYSETIAVGIRRQAEASGSKATIGSLLRRIQDQSGAFTAERCGFVGIETLEGRQHAWLKFAPSLKQSLDPARVAALRDELNDARDKTKKWVDKRIAHMDMQTDDLDVWATFDDLEKGLRGLRSGVMFLYSLFHPNTVLWQITPTPPGDWFRMFERPWYVPGARTAVDASDDVPDTH